MYNNSKILKTHRNTAWSRNYFKEMLENLRKHYKKKSYKMQENI